MRLTDEQKGTHLANAEMGVRVLLRSIAGDISAIDDLLSRWGFDAETHESTIEALELVEQLIRPTRECLDLNVRAYAAASIDKLRGEPVDDCYTPEG